MKLYFSCSTKQITKYKDLYRAIRNTIKSLGHSLTRDWIDYSITHVESDVPGSEVYPEVIVAILAAEIIVLEGTVPSASVGHQLAFALQKGKPVLLLAQIPKKELENTFVSGMQSPLLTLASYKDQKDLTRILEDYLAEVGRGAKVRFNLVMERGQDSYIEWAAFTYKKSKTEMIKKAIQKQIETDKRYQQYLKSSNRWT